METLRQTIPGSAQHERHERRRQGAAAVHQQVAYGVGHGVVADEEPLEDLPVGARGDPQGENRGPQSKRPTLGHGAPVEQEVEREADAEGREGVGQLVVGDDLLEEAEHEAKGPRKRRQAKSTSKKAGRRSLRSRWAKESPTKTATISAACRSPRTTSAVTEKHTATRSTRRTGL